MKRIISILMLMTIIVSSIRFDSFTLEVEAANSGNSPWGVSAQNDENILFYPVQIIKQPKSYEKIKFHIHWQSEIYLVVSIA